MTVRAVEGKKPYTGGKGIEIDENKVISLRLRDENNLIIWDEGDNEIYVDLQLDDEIRPTDAFPVGITTGRVIIDNGWDKTGTLICAKTTSGDNIKIFYSDDGHLYVDHGTGLFTQVYLKPEVDALLSDLRNYVDTELAKKQDKLIAGDNIEIAQDGKTISAILPPLNRFLSLWNCSTGMPISFPTSQLPFEYVAGDHFLVETVDSTTNYRPSGTEYDGTASQTVETADVEVGDVYIYDGTTWLLQINHDKNVSFANIAGQPSDNQALAQALNSKQNTLTAGQNINIDQNNEISATDTTYNAGTGIEIKNGTDYSAMQGPAPDGFHVPLNTEWQAVYNIRTALGGGSDDGDNFGIALKLPYAGLRHYSSAGVYGQGTNGYYWSSSRSYADGAYRLYFNSTALSPQSSSYRAYGFSVRCFKNSPIIPTSSWTKLYGTSIEAGGIFWSSTDGLISLSSDGQTWITIQDKNLGATQVWNSGDTLSEANCGKYYQWGNNYGFPRTGSVTTSSTQVDASNYGPGNYYSSNTFIKYDGRWDTTDNANLRGGETGVVTIENAITNTGVLSVNGQTGDVTIQTGGTYTAGNGISIDANNEISVDTDVVQEKLTAGEGISIGEGQICVEESDRKGPAPSGFHVPSTTEWQGVKTIMDGLGLTTGDGWSINLHMPYAGQRNYSSTTISGQSSEGYYWASSPYGGNPNGARYLHLNPSAVRADYGHFRANGYSVRCFKNTYVEPDNSWTAIKGTLGGPGIFRNQIDGLISITLHGDTGYTLQDKNLGATAVYNDGDTLTQANMGNMYQWGNNYGFPSTGTISNTSSTQVDASGYGPNNYYSSDTFITGSQDWSSVHNDDLWGNTSNSTHQECTTGQLTISADTAVLATKKYVDDNVVQKSSTAPSNPSQGDQWYDTTNDELKIYDGSAWNAVGGGGDVGVSTQANNVFTPGMKIWGGTSANYANLTPDGNTAYLII